jgi:sialidase-1
MKQRTLLRGKALVLLLFGALFFTRAAPAKEPPVAISDILVAGQAGYHTFRIPAVVTTRSGALLVFCEGRTDGDADAGDIDLLVVRSVDHGKSWSQPAVVWDDAANTCGNPCPVVDQSTGEVWLAMTWNHGDDTESQIMAGQSRDARHVFVTHSTDEGQSWAAPRRISDDVRRPHWRWYATGPGNAIQLVRGPNKGRLLIPANHSDHSDPARHPYRSHVFWSDDHGQTWQLGGVQEDRTNESALVEREDGSILQVMRSYHGRNRRAMAVSSDGGATWGKVYLDEALDTPVCQASVLRYPRDPLADAAEPGEKSRILFSSPRGADRSHLTVWLSYDEGRTWPRSRLLYGGSAAYSNLLALPEERVGLVFERDNYQKLSLATCPLAWLESED